MRSKKLVLVCIILLGLGILLITPASADPVIQGAPVSCYDILLRGDSTGDGVYSIDPDGPGGEAPVDVYCDMTTDGGGWTLVGSSRSTTFNDQASLYYADLATLAPAAGHNGIWDGMRQVALSEQSDLRFSCRVDPDGSSFDVDLAFYDVPWYKEITAAPNDGGVCFEEENGAGQTLPPPARQNLLTAETRPLGDQWNAGYLEGEDSCGDTSDFTVDFDDRGMDSNQSDGTDWGEDDGSRKCGISGTPDGAWFVWVREAFGLFLDPASLQKGELPGGTVVYTVTLVNATGVADSFDVALLGDDWATSISITNTGMISYGMMADIVLVVDVPAGASPGDFDDVTIEATSVLSPTGFFATAEVRTYALSGQYGYVFNANQNEIDLVDTLEHVNTGMAIDTSPYGLWPWDGALSPDGQSLYVSLRDSDAVLVVDTLSNTPVISIPVGDEPFGIDFSTDGAYAFVANWNEDTVSVIDTALLTVTATIPVGDGPQTVAASPCLDKIYVPNRWNYTVDVIDTSLMTVTATISGFTNQLFDIVISPYGHRAYVTDQWAGTIYVIDTLSDTWIDTWYVGAYSQNGLDLSPDGRVLYMTSNSDGIVYALDAFTGQILHMSIVGPGYGQRSGWSMETFPAGMGDFAYISLPGLGQLSVLDTNTHEQVGIIDLGGGPRGMALFPPEAACLSGVLLDPPHAVQSGLPGDSVTYVQTLHNLSGVEDSFSLGVAHVWPTSLSLFDTGLLPVGGWVTFTVEVDVPPGAQMTEYDIATLSTVSNSNPAVNAQAYLMTAVPRPGFVFNADNNLINVVDTATHVNTGIVIDTEPYGDWPWAGELSPDGGQLYVSLRDSNRVLVVDTATYSPVITIPVETRPFEIAFRSDGMYVFVGNFNSNTVSVIDTQAQVVTATIPVGNGPQGMAASPCQDKIYLTTRWDYDVYVIDTIQMTVTTVITGFTDQLFDVVISPLGDRVYVTNQWDFDIYVIDTATDTWIDTFGFPEDVWIESIESIDISPDGQVLYITSNADGRTYALDASTGDFLGQFGTGPTDWMQGSWGIEVFPWWAGPYAYVSSPLHWDDPTLLGDVKVLNLETGQVVGNIYLGGGPRGMALFPPASTCGALPGVDFIPALSTIQVGESITFTSSTGGYPPPDLTWDFGDGSPGSSEANPVHTFLTEGIFDVELLAENLFGEASATGVVTVYLQVDANFSPLDGAAVVGKEMVFTNLSTGTGPLVYTWDFGDGSPLSNDVNPVHIYTTIGTYTVTLTVDGPYGQDVVTGTIDVGLRQYLPVIMRN